MCIRDSSKEEQISMMSSTIAILIIEHFSYFDFRIFVKQSTKIVSKVRCFTHNIAHIIANFKVFVQKTSDYINFKQIDINNDS